MTSSVGFSDMTDGSQSPSCNICVVNYRLRVYTWIFWVLCRVIVFHWEKWQHTAVLTLNVLIMEGMALVAVAERHLSSSTLLCWFVAAEPSTYCKYCMYSLFIFAVYLYGE